MSSRQAFIHLLLCLLASGCGALSTELQLADGDTFEPSQLTGLQGWYQASDLATLADNAPLSDWSSHLGKGAQLLDTGLGATITFHLASGPGSTPVVETPGGGHYFTRGSSLFYSGVLSEATIFLVSKSGGASNLLNWGNGTEQVNLTRNSGTQYVFTATDGSGHNADSNLTLSSTSVGDSFLVHEMRWRGAAQATDYAVASDSVTANGSNGSLPTSFNLVTNGVFNIGQGGLQEILELIVYTRALSDSEMLKVRAYLRARHGI